MRATGVSSVYFLVIFLAGIRASLISTKLDLCGPMSEIVLDFLDESSVTIALVSDDYMPNCRLKIIAPETHVIYLNIIETTPPQFHRDALRTRRLATCQLKVYQNESSDPVWTGDLCTPFPLTDIDLLRPEITLEWTPPADSSHFKGKKLIATAVGRNDVCKDSLQHTCMSIGHEPLFCVSKYLLCDGNRNCPKGATRNDEDDKICKVWNILFREFTKSGVNDKILNLLMSQTTKSPKVRPIWQDWSYIHRLDLTTLMPPTTTTTVETQTSNMESLSVALSHYGPWGYILLGMLICGTVLMFCGVWECFRKPKPASPQETVPNSPTAVLIINPPADNNPPSYDDLDPPSYSTLFPNVKEDDPVEVTNSTPGSSTTANAIRHPEEAPPSIAVVDQTQTDVSFDTPEHNNSIDRDSVADTSSSVDNEDNDKVSNDASTSVTTSDVSDFSSNDAQSSSEL